MLLQGEGGSFYELWKVEGYDMIFTSALTKKYNKIVNNQLLSVTCDKRVRKRILAGK